MNKAPSLYVTIETPYCDAATILINHLSAELGSLYGDDGTGAFAPSDVDVPGGAFVIAWLDSQPVGCGALRPMEPGIAEIKRMFVEPTMRRQGVARQMLQTLEELARAYGYSALRLETGVRQPEATTLYESTGFQRIPCYGRYAGQLLSVCYEKSLVSSMASNLHHPTI
ncbi:MAG: GNAT family N-acetyltransferase [Chloroflexi bacterium]|nr:GNAT family N-acetyltransferase [Chloroflexota bacterium]